MRAVGGCATHLLVLSARFGSIRSPDIDARASPRAGGSHRAREARHRGTSPDRASTHHRARTLLPNRGTRCARGNPALLPNVGPRRHPRPYVRCRARTFWST